MYKLSTTSLVFVDMSNTIVDRIVFKYSCIQSKMKTCICHFSAINTCQISTLEAKLLETGEMNQITVTLHLQQARPFVVKEMHFPVEKYISFINFDIYCTGINN